MDKSYLNRIVSLIRRFKCVKDYHLKQENMESAYEHISFGMVFSLLFCALSVLSKLLLLGPVLLFLVSVIWKELWHDRKKNKGKPKGDIYAQLIERSVGYVLCLPFIITSIFI